MLKHAFHTGEGNIWSILLVHLNGYGKKKGGGPTFGKSSQIIPYFFPEVTPFLMVIGWYDININIEIFKFEYRDIQIWISGYSNLNISMSQWPISASGYSNLKIGIFKFEYPNVSMVNLGFGIFKFENRDFQIWKSRFSNLNIKMMLFKI